MSCHCTIGDIILSPIHGQYSIANDLVLFELVQDFRLVTQRFPSSLVLKGHSTKSRDETRAGHILLHFVGPGELEIYQD